MNQEAEVVHMLLETFDKELHEKTLRKEAFEDGYNEGEAKERATGIRNLITTLREVDFPREIALEKLKEKYGLSLEEAKSYLDKYWK